MTFIDPDIVCFAPAGQLKGAAAFREFMEPFSRSVMRAELLAAFGDEGMALLMYDTETVPVPAAPGAERLIVVDGLITEIRIIFDRVPFAAARAAATS